MVAAILLLYLSLLLLFLFMFQGMAGKGDSAPIAHVFPRKGLARTAVDVIEVFILHALPVRQKARQPEHWEGKGKGKVPLERGMVIRALLLHWSNRRSFPRHSLGSM
jgi:hypothetical protein